MVHLKKCIYYGILLEGVIRFCRMTLNNSKSYGEFVCFCNGCSQGKSTYKDVTPQIHLQSQTTSTKSIQQFQDFRI